MLAAGFSRFGTGTVAKPIYFFSFLALTVSLVFTSLILMGSTSNAVRKFYLISLKYNPSSTKSSIITGLDGLLKGDKGNMTFSIIRVGYRGVCMENTKSGWDCASNGSGLPGGGNIGGDPLDLVSIADLYRDKITFSGPLFLAIIGMGLAWLGVVVNCIPVIPVPGFTKKMAAFGAAVGSAALMCAMGLQQVTTGTVSNLVQKMGMNAVEIKVGSANVGFGWTAFALCLLASIGTMAIVIAEWGVAKAEAKIQAKGEQFVGKASGGRINLEEARSGFSEMRAFALNPAPKKAAATLGSRVMRH